MDPYIRIIKYIFTKNNRENEDNTIDEFFDSGISFPNFVAILFGEEKIPGCIISSNKFQKANNNTKALAYLGQKNPFFKSYQVDFKNHNNIISLINYLKLIIYF